jgi:bifunctional pyridoxal-dependent enzyme with beta-cystathionase and maltose regulon repressor activities
MSMNTTTTPAYADLGSAWLKYQTARIQQRHLQFGRHFRLDLDALLRRLATAARATRVMEAPAPHVPVSTIQMRRELIEAIDLCARVDASMRAPTLDVIAA